MANDDTRHRLKYATNGHPDRMKRQSRERAWSAGDTFRGRPKLCWIVAVLLEHWEISFSDGLAEFVPIYVRTDVAPTDANAPFLINLTVKEG